MFSDPELYSKNHSVQTRDANRLLDCVLPGMSFDEADVIMDMGCGSGGNTRAVLLPRLQKLKKLIGIDVKPSMIEFASTRMTHEKIEYHVANIEDRTTLKFWEGSISKILSVHCFQWLKNQRKGIESLYSLLKSKGEAALLFLTSTAMWDTYPTLMYNEKWKEFLNDADQCIPEFCHQNLREKLFKELLEDMGFEVLICCEEESDCSFKTNSEAKIFMSLVSSMPSYIPEQLKEEFMDDFLNALHNLCPRNSEGLSAIHYTYLIVHIRKP